MNWTHLLFGFRGRIRRRDYWLGVVIAGLAFVLALAALAVMFGFFPEEGQASPAVRDTAALTLFGLVAALFVGYLWVTAAVAVKRCHDRNYPGLVYLAMFLVGAFIPFGFLWQLIDLGVLEGVPGANDWGPPPKGQAAADAFV